MEIVNSPDVLEAIQVICNASQIKILYEDILSSNADIIVQQVNCKGVMGAGLAKSIKTKYPIVFEKYSKCFEKVSGKELLGKIQIVPVSKTQAVANLFAQEAYGNDHKLYTNYQALKRGLDILSKKDCTVAIPYGLGCGLGGGDWDKVVFPMIASLWYGKEDKIKIYKLNKEGRT